MTPQELSLQRSEARFDITPLLAGDALAREAGGRLLALDQHGFLLRKVETYNSRYRQPGDAYEWAMPTGGHGLRFANPRVLLTMRPLPGGRTVAVALPPLPSRDATQRGRRLAADGGAADAGGARAAGGAGAGRRPARAGPADVRIAELHRVGGDRVSRWAAVEGEAGYKAYRQRLADILALPPRYWLGWEIGDDLLVWHLFRDLLPAPVQDHMRNYWRAWLQPELPTSAFVHPQSRDAIDYWKRNHDWRGRASFFRRRLQLRGQHTELQPHGRDGRPAGRRHDGRPPPDRRRPARAGASGAALLGLAGQQGGRRCSTPTTCRSRSATRRCSPTSRPRRSTG